MTYNQHAYIYLPLCALLFSFAIGLYYIIHCCCCCCILTISYMNETVFISSKINTHTQTANLAVANNQVAFGLNNGCVKADIESECGKTLTSTIG